MRGKFKRIGKRVLITAGVVLLMAVVVLLGMKLYYKSFYRMAEQEFELLALSEDFVPQGFTYADEEGKFLISGYSCEDGAARICIATPDGRYRMVSLLDEAGESFYSHSGGIALHGEYAYLAGCDGRCYVLSAAMLLQEQTTELSLLTSFPTYNAASFCTVQGDSLYVGEYYYPVKYKTDSSHNVMTPSGEENRAIVTVFPLQKDAPYGIILEPDKVLSITKRIQGMCFSEDGRLIMSASSVFQGSQLYVYDYAAAMTEAAGSFSIGERELPMYYVDSRFLKHTMQILPKSEGVCVADDRLYMIFESASNRFQYGKLLGCQYAYSVPVTELE